MIVGGDVPDAPFDAFVSFSTVTLTESLCLRGVGDVAPYGAKRKLNEIY